MMLEIKNLSVRYGPLTIVDEVSFHLAPGQWLMIVGPNGAGKSTLLNAISQGIPYRGSVHFDGEPLEKCKPHALAQKVGVLMQDHYVSYAFTVSEVVWLGRYAHGQSLFSKKGEHEAEKVKNALIATGMLSFEHHSVLTLSGGELQRTFLSQLLAQDPELLLLDEPTNHLDLAYQKQTFELIQQWIKKSGRSVISVVHDLSLAQAYGTQALLLNQGKVVSFGPVDEVLTRRQLDAVYGLDVYGWMRHLFTQWKE